MTTTSKTQGGMRHLEASRPVRVLGRFGDVCYGVVYLVVSWLAFRIAFGDPGTEADQRGAITTIAAQPFGVALLWVLAVGLVAFGVWQSLAAITGYRWIITKRERATRRLTSACRAIVVLAIAAFTLRLLVGDGGSGGANSGQQEMTARLLAVPGGRVLVFVIGLGVLVAAALSARRGMRQRFLRELDLTGASTTTRRYVRWSGAIGYLAKGVAWAVIGVLLCVAAVQLDPKRAGGLDKALRTLAAQPFGVVLLVAVALGFVAFGVYSFGDARYRRT